MKKIIMLFLKFLLLSACANSFQPPPYTSEQWKREKTTLFEVEEEMLDCGYPSFAGAGRNASDNEIAIMQLCMQKKGFKYTNRLGIICDSYPSLPACVEARREDKS